MLKVCGLRYSYPGRDPALLGVSASFPRGLTLVAGANASGKSTLLLLLAGLIEPDAGSVVDGGGAVLDAGALRSLARLVGQDADPQILGATVGEDV